MKKPWLLSERVRVHHADLQPGRPGGAVQLRGAVGGRRPQDRTPARGAAVAGPHLARTQLQGEYILPWDGSWADQVLCGNVGANMDQAP